MTWIIFLVLFIIFSDGVMIAGATDAKVDVFDMQGRPVFSAKNVKKAVELSGLSEGLFVVRVRDGSKRLMQRITIK